MIDVHCHLVDAKYQDTEIQRMVNEACEAGVEMIANSTGITESRKTIEIAEKTNRVWVCVGMHPEVIQSSRFKVQNSIQKLKVLTKHKKVVGVGEIGLDYREGITDEEKLRQKEL